MNPRLQARLARGLACLAATLALAACNNSPYPDGAAATNTLFYSFDERSPRYLDPTASYSNPESAYTYQVYEPLYGYHYLKRPYELVPKAAAQVVKPYYLDKAGQRLRRRRRARPDRAERVRDSDQARHHVRAASGVRQEQQGRAPLPPPHAGPSSATSARPGTSSSRARASWSPTTSSMRSSAMPRHGSRRRCSRCSPNT